MNRILAGVLLVAGALVVWTFFEKPWVTSRVYRIGWEEDPPEQFRGIDGRPTGLSIELVAESARRSGIRLQWVQCHESSEAALRSGQVDLWPLMTITPERAKVVHISAPYLESLKSFLVRRNSAFQRTEDLAKATIGYLGFPISVRQVHALLPDARTVAIPSPRDLMEAVCQQKVDAAFLEQHTAITGLMSGVTCPQQPLQVISVPNARVSLGIGSTFEAADAADRIRDQIDAMAAEGKLAELFAKWGYLSGRNIESVQALLDARRRQRWTLVAAAVFAALFVIAWWQAVRAVRQRNRIRQAEMALRESEQRYRSLIETAQEGIWTVNDKGLITYVNEKLVSMLGYAREELLGQSVHQFVDPSLQQESRNKAVRRRQGIKEQYDFIFRRKDGSPLHAIVSANPVIDSRGVFTGALGMIVDITARKETEEALRKSEEKYRNFYEEDLAAYFISSPDGRLLECNPAFLRMFRFASREQAFERSLASVWPNPEAREAFVQLVDSRGTLQEYEAELRRSDGTALHATGNVIGSRDAQGKLVQIRGYIIDNTERRKAEEQLRRSQKLDAIGRLAGGVAHDFNNLLTVIIGYSSHLLSKLRPVDSTYGDASEIKAAAQRAAALTNQLLAFGRKQVLQPRVLNVNEVITHMREMLQRLVGEHIDLVVIPHSKLDMVKADAVQLEQVIMNLVINSRDAMPRGGRITIETTNAVLSEEDVGRPANVKPGAYVMLAVSDNGCGMDAETQARIFDPFFTTKEKSHGTGLGLSTVYGIVNQSGGCILVYSELGRGTTFKIYLPAVEDAASPLPDEEMDEEPCAGSETILVAEDDETIRVLVRGVLAEKGYTVLMARDPLEAIQLQQLHEGPIDLLLTDMVMPHMNGRELAEKLAPERPQMKVLYMSGYTEDAMIHQGVLAPGTVLLRKPFGPQLLLRQVRRVLKSSGDGIGVLVVDDHAPVRRLTRAALEDGGYRVLEAADSKEALARLSETKIHLVITDLNLPGGQSGGELAKAVTSQFPGVKVIVMSGSFGSAQDSLAKRIGIHAILPKPTEPDALLETVRAVLRLKSGSEVPS